MGQPVEGSLVRPAPASGPGLALRSAGGFRAAQRQPAVVRAACLGARALARKCPNCGGGNTFRNYLRQRDVCPDCCLRLDRGETDFFIGAYTINLIVAELLVVVGGAAAVLVAWPDVPWNAIMYGLVALMIAAPILLYPVSRQLWLALDLFFQPAGTSDFDMTFQASRGVDNLSPPGGGQGPGPFPAREDTLGGSQ
jgi:uncharacterized protein (DUF983 family)